MANLSYRRASGLENRLVDNTDLKGREKKDWREKLERPWSVGHYHKAYHVVWVPDDLSDDSSAILLRPGPQYFLVVLGFSI